MISRASVSKESRRLKYELIYRVFESNVARTGKDEDWPEMVKEFHFCPDRKWRADYAFPNDKLLIEIEGGVWSGGRHFRGVGAIKDMEKYNEAAILGYRLLRFTPKQIKGFQALRSIKRWFDNKRGITGKTEFIFP